MKFIMSMAFSKVATHTLVLVAIFIILFIGSPYIRPTTRHGRNDDSPYITVRHDWNNGSLYITAGHGGSIGNPYNATRHHRNIDLLGNGLSTTDDMLFALYGIGDIDVYSDSLLHYIRAHISKPSTRRPLKLSPSNWKTIPDYSQAGQSSYVDKLLGGRRNGFFVESGAADGQTFSNSLFFELERNWTGILIEANPDFSKELLERNRNAFVLQACISTENRPSTVNLRPAGLIGGITEKMHKTHLSFVGEVKRPDVKVNCFPLNSIIAALGRPLQRIDYMSLDVEGPELEILQTVDWSSVFVDVLTVEYRIYAGVKGLDRKATGEKLALIRQFFNSTGLYREVAKLPVGSSDDNGLDVVFRRLY